MYIFSNNYLQTPADDNKTLQNIC